MQRVVPSPTISTDVMSAYAEPLGTSHDGPWISLCMVNSLDGSTVVDGLSSGLSSENDLAVLAQLRSLADVILVGSATARGEGYGPPKKPGQRIGVVSGRGSVDTSTELFTSGAGFVITTDHATIAPDVDVVRAGQDTVDLRAAVAQLGTVCSVVDVVQAEGGPTLNGALAEADLLDEINLTTSPAAVGGDGPRLFSGAPSLSRRFSLEQLVVDDESFVFSRWRRERSSP